MTQRISCRTHRPGWGDALKQWSHTHRPCRSTRWLAVKKTAKPSPQNCQSNCWYLATNPSSGCKLISMLRVHRKGWSRCRETPTHTQPASSPVGQLQKNRRPPAANTIYKTYVEKVLHSLSADIHVSIHTCASNHAWLVVQRIAVRTMHILGRISTCMFTCVVSSACSKLAEQAGTCIAPEAVRPGRGIESPVISTATCHHTYVGLLYKHLQIHRWAHPLQRGDASYRLGGQAVRRYTRCSA